MSRGGIAQPCANCLSLYPWRMKEHWWIYAHKQPSKKTRAKTIHVCEWFLPGGTITDLSQSHTPCAAYMHLCFTLEKSQWELIAALLTVRGEKRLWFYSRKLAGHYRFELLVQYSRVRKSWLFQETNLFLSQPSKFPVAAKIHLEYLHFSFFISWPQILVV